MIEKNTKSYCYTKEETGVHLTVIKVAAKQQTSNSLHRTADALRCNLPMINTAADNPGMSSMLLLCVCR
jgi:hypothetical protein